MTEREGVHSPSRISSLQRSFEERIANPFLRFLLRSSLHWPVSNWLLLVSYVGSKSGRRYTFPVAYKRFDTGVVAVTPKHESNWWKNFRTARQCTIWIRGRRGSVTGTLVTDDDRQQLLTDYFDTYRFLGRILDFEDDSTTSVDQSERTKRDLAVIRFTSEE